MNPRSYYKNSGLIKSPNINELNKNFANLLLARWHYLGKIIGIIHAYGHKEGCLVFTNCRSRLYEKKLNEKGISVIELARMVGKPNHKWAMSSLMSKCVKAISKLNLYDLIVTYSDPFAGHNGNVYKSSGWLFDGIIIPDGHPLFFIDGKRVSPRTLYDRHGTQAVGKMKEIYKNRLILKEKPLKKRFIKNIKKLKQPLQGELF